MNRRTRFRRSKCQRCGRVVGSQYGEADLWTLPPDWPAPLGDYGAFCEECIARYTQAEWLAWYEEQHVTGARRRADGTTRIGDSP